MEKRSRRRVPELVTRLAFQGLSENEIGRARISMMARNANVPFKGRIQKRKTYHLQIITFRLQRAAGPYRCAKGLNRSRGRALRRAAWPWMDDGSVLPDDEGPEASPEPMIV